MYNAIQAADECGLKFLFYGSENDITSIGDYLPNINQAFTRMFRSLTAESLNVPTSPEPINFRGPLHSIAPRN